MVWNYLQIGIPVSEFCEKSFLFKVGCGCVLVVLYVIKRKLSEEKRETIGDQFIPEGTSEVAPEFYSILNEQFYQEGN